MDEEKRQNWWGNQLIFPVFDSKGKNPNSVDRFRPISLCNTSYKIITKILATRMKNIMKHIISESQEGFVVRRHILDNIIIVQEAIHSSMERKQ